MYNKEGQAVTLTQDLTRPSSSTFVVLVFRQTCAEHRVDTSRVDGVKAPPHDGRRDHTSSTQSNVRALPDVAGRASYNTTSNPSLASIHAAPQPAIPPPTTATVPRFLP